MCVLSQPCYFISVFDNGLPLISLLLCQLMAVNNRWVNSAQVHLLEFVYFIKCKQRTRQVIKFLKKTQKFWILFVSLVFEPFINGIVHCDPLTLTSEGVQKTLSDSKILGSSNMTMSNVKNWHQNAESIKECLQTEVYKFIPPMMTKVKWLGKYLD